MWIIDALKLVGWQALQATLLFVAAGWLVIANRVRLAWFLKGVVVRMVVYPFVLLLTIYDAAEALKPAGKLVRYED